jgi:hypothetical protein
MGHHGLLSMAIDLMAVTFRALLILQYSLLYWLYLQAETAFSAQINATGLKTHDIRRRASR